MNNDNVLNNIKEFINSGLSDYIEKGMQNACLIVEADAKQNCPVDDGQLRQSITHDVEIDEISINGFVGTNVEYAPYVHVGTGILSSKGDGRKTPWKYKDVNGEWHITNGMKPNPFLQTAVDDNKSNILNQFKDLF